MSLVENSAPLSRTPVLFTEFYRLFYILEPMNYLSNPRTEGWYKDLNDDTLYYLKKEKVWLNLFYKPMNFIIGLISVIIYYRIKTFIFKIFIIKSNNFFEMSDEPKTFKIYTNHDNQIFLNNKFSGT